MSKTTLFKTFCKIVERLPTDVKKDLRKEISQIKAYFRDVPRKPVPTTQKTYVLCWRLNHIEFKGTLLGISEELELVNIKLSPATIYNSIVRDGLYKGFKNGGFTIKPVE